MQTGHGLAGPSLCVSGHHRIHMYVTGLQIVFNLILTPVFWLRSYNGALPVMMF